jgi:hypothetical protein
MAYALGFPRDVTDLIYSMRDWRGEMVRASGGTPSRLCFEIGVWPVSQEKPRLRPIGMPYYEVQSDNEDPEYGEVVLDLWSREGGYVQIERHSLQPEWIGGISYSNFKSFRLRESRGRVSGKFLRLQKQNDLHVQQMWFQCEPCESRQPMP